MNIFSTQVDELQTRFDQSDDGNTMSPTSRINVCLGWFCRKKADLPGYLGSESQPCLVQQDFHAGVIRITM